MSSGFTSAWLRDFEARGGCATEQANAPSSLPAHERDLHVSIIGECDRRGWLVLHGSMTKLTHRIAGEFDFIILADQGRVLFVEAKSKTGKLSPEQLALHAWAKKLGHTPVVARSLQEFIAHACAEVGA